MKAFRKIKAVNTEVAALQTQVEAVLNPIAKVPVIDGVLIKDIVITDSGTQIEHGLTRQPLGWILVDNDADCRIWRTAWDQYTISLDSSLASPGSTISIWVF